MKLVFLIIIIKLFTIVASDCPPEGIVCYPQDCSAQYQKCVDNIFYAPEDTPTGFLCNKGILVFTSVCVPPTPAPTCPTDSSCSLSQVFTEADYNILFPQANGGAINKVANQHAIFNYSYLLSAAKHFPEFACSGSLETRKKEVAAFLGQTSQETSGWWGGQPYYWGYYFSTEVGCTDETCQGYCDPTSIDYPCTPGKGYFGRGPIQLSWNYNYGQISQALYGDKSILLNNPDMIFVGENAFLSALWFWMTPQNPKPSCHDVITGNWTPTAADIAAGRLSGYGMTTNIINGAIECSKPTPQSVTNRVEYFKTYADRFKVSVGDNLYCDQMGNYT